MSDSESSLSSIAGSLEEEERHPLDKLISQRIYLNMSDASAQLKPDGRQVAHGQGDSNSRGTKRRLQTVSLQPVQMQLKASRDETATAGKRTATASRQQSPESGEVPAEDGFDLEDDIEAAMPGDEETRTSSSYDTIISDASDDDPVDAKPGLITPLVPLGVVVLKEGQENDRNSEMRRLLRMPRYFDPDYEEAGPRCFKCGGKGHMARDCTNQAKERPCFLCAQLGHDSRDCPNSLCFRCNRPGHMARDCTYGYKSSSWEDSGPPVCLRCGQDTCPCAGQRDYVRAEGGCSSDYINSDLAHICCMSCGQRGHLNCKDAPSQPAKLSCYNCGEGGHTADECWKETTSLVSRERMGSRQPVDRPLWSNQNTRHNIGSAGSRHYQHDHYSNASNYGQQYISYRGNSRHGQHIMFSHQPASKFSRYSHFAEVEEQYQNNNSQRQLGRYVESYHANGYDDYHRTTMDGGRRR